MRFDKRLVLVVVAVVVVVIMAAAIVISQMLRPHTQHIAFIAPGFTSPFHVAAADGAKQAAQALSWNLEVQSPNDEGDFAGQAKLFQQVVDNSVDAVILNSIQIEAMVSPLKSANKKNIPVVMYNFITPLSEGKTTSYIGYDQWGGSEKLGIYSCQLLANKYHTTIDKATGKIFILTGIDSIFSHRRTQGYKAGLATCPKVQIVGEQPADWLRNRGEVVATAALQSTPDIDLFYGNSDEMAIGAAQAGEKLGLKINQDFFAISIDGNQPTLDLIKAGKFTATLGVYPYRMGQATIDLVDRILRGQTVPQVVLTPSTIVDSTNLDDYVAGKTWTEPIAGAPELDNGKPTIDKGAATVSATGPATAAAQ